MARLKLHIEAPEGTIPVPEFVRVLQSATGALGRIGDAIDKRQSANVQWFIDDLQIGSAETVISSRSNGLVDDDFPVLLCSEYVNGLATLQEGDHLPPYLIEYDLRKVGATAKWFANDESTYLDALSLDNHASAHVTRRTATNVYELMSEKNKGIGSVIGKLEVISLRGGARFNVYDQLWNRAVSCRFPAQDLETVKNALGLRVRVRGVIYRNRRGQPLRVDKPTLEVLPFEEDLPGFEELVGLDPNFTGSVATGTYIERLS